ncbi:ArsR/SmtB family transcription factor [Actinospica robiniae]|uniref:ArsR/SmtB family transcription factor n=1 Tax=Actinospica robiniae TaxID=304901 RepID=UPI0004028B02|nr:helix-turn-helix domain-containing protein [Actinospica robiniae]
MTVTTEIREITDLEALAATAHPIRRRLLDFLDVEGEMTATAMAESSGQSVRTIERHLHLLEESRLVEQSAADEDGERPWRRSAPGMRTQTNDLADDAVTRAVIFAMLCVTRERHAGFMREWTEARETFGPDWKVSGFVADCWLRLSPAELVQVRGEFADIFERWSTRDVPDDGVDRRPVTFFAQAVRAQP